MTIDSKRLARQKSILRKWVSKGCRGTLEACTGFGKTYTAVLAISKMKLCRKFASDPVSIDIERAEDWDVLTSHTDMTGRNSDR